MRKLLAALIVGLHFAALPPCHAQQVVYGAIESLDTELGTLTLLLPPKHEPKQFNLARPDLPVSNALGQALKLAGLREKQRVALTLDEADDIAAIRLDDNCLWAYIVKADVKERQLTIKYGHVQRSLDVPENTVVLHDGEKAALDDLKVGKGIKALFGADQQTLVQIQCGKGISGVSPYHRWILESGILLKVDHKAKTFQIVTQYERINLQDHEFQPEAILRLVHSSYLLRTTGIEALHAFCKVSFYFESDSKKVVQVTAQVPTLVRRRVEAIDRDARLLTVVVDEKAVPLRIAEDAMIRNLKGLARLQDIEAAKLVTCGLTLDNREIVFIYLWD